MFWSNGTTKTYIIAFAKLFSDIHVNRVDNLDVVSKDIKVPLIYASKNKISYVLQSNANTNSSSIVLPIIGFNIEGLTYNPERKLNSLNSIQVEADKSIFEGIPYDYNFIVTIKTKYQDDLWQILEQVLYHFKPDISLAVKELPYVDYVRDVSVVLQGVSFENEIELDQSEESQREFVASLDLILKGFIYPSATTDSVINNVDINFIDKLNKQILNISHDFIDPNIVTTITENS